MGWQQRFDRCRDRLILRVGGPGGPLISWPDRGLGGQWTWSMEDPVGELRDISAWVGNSVTIRLYALILDMSEMENQGCEMATFYNDAMCKAWYFDADEDQIIMRSPPAEKQVSP